MTAYPSTTYAPREKANRPGIVYDPDKKYAGYAEDITNLDAEVVAIENDLRNNIKPEVEKLAAGVSGSFQSADGKTITVTDGVVTAIT